MTPCADILNRCLVYSIEFERFKATTLSGSEFHRGLRFKARKATSTDYSIHPSVNTSDIVTFIAESSTTREVRSKYEYFTIPQKLPNPKIPTYFGKLGSGGRESCWTDGNCSGMELIKRDFHPSTSRFASSNDQRQPVWGSQNSRLNVFVTELL